MTTPEFISADDDHYSQRRGEIIMARVLKTISLDESNSLLIQTFRAEELGEDLPPFASMLFRLRDTLPD